MKEEIKKDLIEKLNEYEGQRVYACDLAYTLFESYNIDGSVTYSTYDAKEWIKKYFNELGEVVEEIKFNLGSEFIPNIFEEPERFMVVIYLEVGASLLSQCKFIDDNWNNEIELTDENIEIIKKELESLEV
jgi:hypothetical protein